MSDQDLLKKLTEMFPEAVKADYPWPQAYCENTANARAIVLGTDPSYYPEKGKEFRQIRYVFELETYKEKRNNPYFDPTLNNLESVGLGLDTVYVENLCRNYFHKITYHNKDVWKQAAAFWIPLLVAELDQKCSNKTMPVLLTTEILYQILINDESQAKTAKELYARDGLVPVPADQNKLGRPLIPLYRHYEYELKRHTEYRDRVKKILNG
jgi:hypothetical protein